LPWAIKMDALLWIVAGFIFSVLYAFRYASAWVTPETIAWQNAALV